MNIGADPLLFWLCVGPALLYVAFQLLLSVGILRLPRNGVPFSGRISVLVAARNESSNITQLLDALLHQTKRPDEIVVVDDRSTDGTGDIVRSFARMHPLVKLVRVDALPAGFPPKKHALEQGIQACTGDLICLTDADCLPPVRWLELLSGLAEPGVSMVVGSYSLSTRWGDIPPTPLQKLLDWFLRYEKFRGTLLSAGAHGLGFPWMASGASLAYRKSAFLEIGGFASTRRSLGGDDDLLLQQLQARRPGTIRCLLHPEATVATYGPSTFRQFLQQRFRHFSAGKFYARSVLAWLALYHSANTLATAALIVSFVVGPGTVLSAYALKLCGDLILLVAGDSRLRRPDDWKYFVPLEILYIAYIALIGPLSLVVRLQWKPETKS